MNWINALISIGLGLLVGLAVLAAGRALDWIEDRRWMREVNKNTSDDRNDDV